MDNNNRNHKFDCPACGKKRRIRDTDFVCPTCYRTHVEEAGNALVQGSVITLPMWVETKALQLLPQLSEQLTEKQVAFKILQARQDERDKEAYDEIKAITGSQYVEKSVFSKALEQKKKELWREQGGDRFFAEMKDLENLIAFIRGTISGIREKATSSLETKTADDSHPGPEAEVVGITESE